MSQKDTGEVVVHRSVIARNFEPSGQALPELEPENVSRRELFFIGEVNKAHGILKLIERNLLSKKESAVTIASLNELKLHVEKYWAAIQRIEDEKGPEPMLQYFQPMFLAFKRIMLLRTQRHIGGGISNIPPPRDNEGNEQFSKENANPSNYTDTTSNGRPKKWYGTNNKSSKSCNEENEKEVPP